jgi:hypothetical protein
MSKHKRWVLSIEMTSLFVKPGKDDVHEQREPDQPYEGVITLKSRPRHPKRRRYSTTGS